MPKKELDYIKEALSILAKGQTFHYIDIDKIEDEELKEMCVNINSIYKKIEELNEYSSALSNGNLDVEFPPRNNYLVGGLKELHSNLLHLTWKVNQISKGHYNQKVDFMGRFSDAFNDMVLKLKTRELQLSESQDVLELLFRYSNIMIFVIDVDTQNLIYCKEKISGVHNDSSDISRNIIEELKEKTCSASERSFDWDLFSKIDNKWYMVKSMAMSWREIEKVYFHMLFDISEHKVKQEKLEDAIMKDGKTGLYNMNYAIQTITSLIAEKEPFCICFFDLDGLKTVNDTMGHLVGDKFIQKFADLVLAEIRADDSLCRIGGDEFLIIAPSSNEKATLKIIDRIEKAVEMENAAGNNPFKLSFSCGIEFSESKLEKTPKELIDSADKKMYKQKRSKKGIARE